MNMALPPFHPNSSLTGCLLKKTGLGENSVFLMSSDWRALIHYVDEGGVTAHMEGTQKWYLNKLKGDV